MRQFNAEETAALLDDRTLIQALREAFQSFAAAE